MHVDRGVLSRAVLRIPAQGIRFHGPMKHLGLDMVKSLASLNLTLQVLLQVQGVVLVVPGIGFGCAIFTHLAHSPIINVGQLEFNVKLFLELFLLLGFWASLKLFYPESGLWRGN